MSAEPATIILYPTERLKMSNFETPAPSTKTTSPDWMFDGVCDCCLQWCPECDPDSYVDEMRDLEYFAEIDATPPF
jgi:hypothetical protein